MDAETKRAKELMKKLPFKEKIKNFWFYYKFHILAAVLVVILFSTSVVKCVRRVDYDLNVLYFGTQQLAPERIEGLEKFIQDNSIDVTDNGKVETLLSVYIGDINSKQQSGERVAMFINLQTEIIANKNPVFITDEALKEIIVDGYSEVCNKVIDLSTVPKLREELGIVDDEKLYWISMTEQKSEGNVLNSFDNAEEIEKWLEKNMK